PGQDGDAVADVISAECTRFGLEVVRSREADAVAHPLGLPSVQASVRAEFVVADVSEPHPSVMLQIGVARGIGAEEGDVLLVAREGSPDTVLLSPFTRLTYRPLDDLRRILNPHLPAMRATHEG